MGAVTAIENSTDRLPDDLAHQMGRPVRYGGEFGGLQERTSHMAKIAEEALAPKVIEDSPNFSRTILRQPHGVAFVVPPGHYP